MIHITGLLFYALSQQSFFIFYFMPAVVVIVVLSQYAATVQETGPEQKDELPRPVRDFDFTNDIWLPMVQTAAALLISLGPAAIWNANIGVDSVNVVGTDFLIAIGFCVLPAVLLTASVDGVLVNFRPDRLWRIMASARWGICIAARLCLTLRARMLLCDSIWGMTSAMAIGFAKPEGGGAPADRMVLRRRA